MLPLNQCDKQNKCVTEWVRSYVRVYSSAGIDPASSLQYEILDGNTYLDKRNPKKFIDYPFSFIFTPEFDNFKMIQHMNLVNDAFEGKGQNVIAEIQKQNMLNFILGNSDEPGFVVELADLLFYETTFYGLKTQKTMGQNKNMKSKQKLGLSVFATEGNSNNFIDLILGQKITYFSRKDMDEYKNVYTHEIISIKQFLILLKIVMVHYRERCREGDPIVFKFLINSYDQPNNHYYTSATHLMVVERNSKIANNLVKKVENSWTQAHCKGEDHGSLANYLQKDMKKKKLVYIYGIPFRHKVMIESKSRFNFLGSLLQKNYIVHRNQVEMIPEKLIKEINQYKIKPYHLGTNSLSYKEVNTIIKLLSKLSEVINDAAYKWKNYCVTVHLIFKVQQQFYQKQRFPVSLEIKDDSYKNFLISKVYKLSENFQMEDLSLEFEKLRTIKNQILLALKSLANLKEVANQQNKSNQLSANNSTLGHQSYRAPLKKVTLHTSSQTVNIQQKQPPRSRYFNYFLEYYHSSIDQLSSKFKLLFNLNYASLKFSNIQLQSDIKPQIFDAGGLKQSINKIKAEVKNLNPKHKQQSKVFLRKIKYEEEIQQSLQLSNVLECQMNGSNSFHNFRKQRSTKSKDIKAYEQVKSNWTDVLNNSSAGKSQIYYNPILKNMKNHHQEMIQQNRSLVSELEGNTGKMFNFQLPKIAVIHRKKKLI